MILHINSNAKMFNASGCSSILVSTTAHIGKIVVEVWEPIASPRRITVVSADIVHVLSS